MFMAEPSKLLNAAERMGAAGEEKQHLVPEWLVTLIADKPWIKAVISAMPTFYYRPGLPLARQARE
jgi:hypothetical protein